MEEKNDNFRPDFLITPYQVAFDNSLHPLDSKVYAVIYWYERLKDGYCWASSTQIAWVANASPRGVKMSLARLEEAGYIRRHAEGPVKRYIETLIGMGHLEEKVNNERTDIMNDRSYNKEKEMKRILNIRKDSEEVGGEGKREGERKGEEKRKGKGKVGGKKGDVGGEKEKEKEKGKEMEMEMEGIVLDRWNSYSIIIHKGFSPSWSRFLRSLLVEYLIYDILIGIDRYAEVLRSPRTYFKHRWTLGEFLQRQNGCRVFIHKSVDDYLSKKSEARREIHPAFLP